MPRTLRQKLAELSPERRERVEKRTRELIEEEMTLRDLRKAMGRTQVKMARALGVGQDVVCRYEARSDMLLSTLGDYIEKMGGELVLTARFPNRAVRIKGLRELSGVSSAANLRNKTPRAKAARRRAGTSRRTSTRS